MAIHHNEHHERVTLATYFEIVKKDSEHFWMLQMLVPGDSLELTSIGVRFPVVDVYEDTSLLVESE